MRPRDSVFKDNYTLAERIVLIGLAARIDGQGKAQLTGDKKYPETMANIRFALSLLGRGAENLPKIDYGSVGWDALRNALALRNRLVHPKSAADLEITDADLEQVRRGRAWFMSTYQSLHAALQKKRSAEFSRMFGEWMKRQNRATEGQSEESAPETCDSMGGDVALRGL